MRRFASIGILLAGLLLAACRNSSTGTPDPGTPGDGGGGAGADPGGSTSGGEAAEPSPAAIASLTVVDPSGASGPFTLGGLERLIVSVEGANLSAGRHVVRVDVTSPGGTLYAQLPGTLTADADRKGHATSALQVRGTVIAGYRRVGTWQFVASVDGVPMAAASVEIR